MLKHLQIHELFVNALMLKISIFSQITLILLVKKWPGEASWYGFSKNKACHQSACPEFSSCDPLSERRELAPLSCLLTSTQALRYAWVLSLFSLCLSVCLPPSLSPIHMHSLSLPSPHKMTKKSPREWKQIGVQDTKIIREEYIPHEYWYS